MSELLSRNKQGDEYFIDSARMVDPELRSGVFVRARRPNTTTEDANYITVDVAALTQESFLLWLRGDGIGNARAELFIQIVLKYEKPRPSRRK